MRLGLKMKGGGKQPEWGESGPRACGLTKNADWRGMVVRNQLEMMSVGWVDSMSLGLWGIPWDRLELEEAGG